MYYKSKEQLEQEKRKLKIQVIVLSVIFIIFTIALGFFIYYTVTYTPNVEM